MFTHNDTIYVISVQEVEAGVDIDLQTEKSAGIKSLPCCTVYMCIC